MRTKTSYILTIMLVLLTTASTESQTITIQHSGANDPTTEGFGSAGTGQAGGVINDLGYNAWVTPWVYGSSKGYGASINNIADVDWILSVTVRIEAAYAAPGEFSVYVDTGASTSPLFNLDFGSGLNGSPIVATGGNKYQYTLTGTGSTYNNYQLVYDAGTETANLWVNGTEELSGIAGQFGPTSAFFDWGGKSSFQGSGTAQADWNLVSLEITPEPSAISLLFFGGGVWIYVRRNYKRRCHQ